MSKYEEVADTLRSRIKSVKLQPGDRLPPTAKLAEQLDASLHTVRDALLVLRAERLLEGRTVAKQRPGTWLRAPNAPNGEMQLYDNQGIVARVWCSGGQWCGQVIGQPAEPPMETLDEAQRQLEISTWVRPERR